MASRARIVAFAGCSAWLLSACGVWPDFATRSIDAGSIDAFVTSDGTVDAWTDVADARVASDTAADVPVASDGGIDGTVADAACTPPPSFGVALAATLSLARPTAMALDPTSGEIAVFDSGGVGPLASNYVFGPPASPTMAGTVTLGLLGGTTRFAAFAAPDEVILAMQGGGSGAPFARLALRTMSASPFNTTPPLGAQPMGMTRAVGPQRAMFLALAGVSGLGEIDATTSSSRVFATSAPVVAVAVDPHATGVWFLTTTGEVMRFPLDALGAPMPPAIPVGSLASSGAPRSIAVDACGIVYGIASAGSNLVERLVPGAPVETLPAPRALGNVSAIAIGAAPQANPHSLYALDTSGRQILELTSLVP